MFMKYCKYFLILSILFLSCNHSNRVKDILPRQSFLKVDKTLEITVCNPRNVSQCLTKKMGATGSGVIVENGDDGSYALTAGHICADKSIKRIAAKVKKFVYHFKVIDLRGRVYPVEILHVNNELDTCILYVRGLKRQAVEISKKKPEEGDRVYNLAAPVGIFDINMVPIFQGFYSGNTKKKAIYTIPAKGGSSGSPIINHRGELVGMVSMAFIYFSHACISPLYGDLIADVHKAIDHDKATRPKLTILHKIMLLWSAISRKSP